MKYAREYKVIAKRMAEATELEQAWKDVEIVYGKKATRQLKELDLYRKRLGLRYGELCPYNQKSQTDVF